MNPQITLAAKATTTTDRGEFTAIAAAYSVDRAGDRIVPGAFAKTIERWQRSGKRIPLHWNHESGPESIIGTVDPAAVAETDDGLQVAGRLDLDNSEKAREAWRAMKTDSMSLSFGYIATSQKATDDDVTELHEIDLFEISVVPGPANADTRFLALKSVREMDMGELREELNTLRKRLDEVDAAIEGKQADDVEDESGQAVPEPQQASDPEAVRIELELIAARTS